MTALALSPSPVRRAWFEKNRRLREYQPQVGYTGPIMGTEDDDDIEDDRFSPSFPERIVTGDEAKMLLIAQGQIEMIANRVGEIAARKGVRLGMVEAFRQLGIDFKSPTGLAEINQDLRWIREERIARKEHQKSLRDQIMEGAFSLIKYVLGVAGLYVIHLIWMDLHK